MRRLNVAITRARRQMTLVSSINHYDLDPTRSAEGVQLLRSPLADMDPQFYAVVSAGAKPSAASGSAADRGSHSQASPAAACDASRYPRRDDVAITAEEEVLMPGLQACARSLLAQFEALPLEADGSTRVPPALRRAMVDLALDVLAGPESRARAGAPEILRILTKAPSRQVASALR
jgi:hypothetical protein